jgi:hypothetical protein
MPSLISSVAPILLLASALAAGCGGDSGPTELALSHVSSNELGLAQAGSYVFRSRSEWEAFWTAHPHPGYPTRQVPAVDFASVAVAGVLAGPKGRCNRLDILSGSLLHGSVTLRYRISTFGAGTPSSCIGNDQFTLNLADFVLVPREATEVKFESE